MGILQGDSPTPGPAMYWQGYHGDESMGNIPAALAEGSSTSHQQNGHSLSDACKMRSEESFHNGTLDSIVNAYESADCFRHSYNPSPVQNVSKQHVGLAKKTEMTDSVTGLHTDSSSLVQHSSPGQHCSSQRDETRSGVFCAGCGLKINDRFYLVAVDKAWHSQCLRCSECHRPLDTQLSCFARQNRIYCKEDYYRLFATQQCAKCQVVLQAHELVMRAREYFYHTRCFSCHVCHVHLTKGSTFGMMGTLIFCKDHYQANNNNNNMTDSNRPYLPTSVETPFLSALHTNAFPNNNNNNHPFNNIPYMYHNGIHSNYGCPPPPPPPPPAGAAQPHPFHHSVTTPPLDAVINDKLYGAPSVAGVFKNRTRKRRSNKDLHLNSGEKRDDCYNSGEALESGLSACGQGQPQQKTKRLRTSFKHHQLRMLKSYFATNHNPDAKDLKQLSQKTTLSKRVLQVWFQNARAKWRRMMQKQESNNNTTTGNNNNNNNNEASSPAYGLTGLNPEESLMTSQSHLNVYDDLSLSGSSSVASVGFPSPL